MPRRRTSKSQRTLLKRRSKLTQEEALAIILQGIVIKNFNLKSIFILLTFVQNDICAKK
jgi:hypothetical protein